MVPESELRRDPLTGRWVIISKKRMERPYEFKKPDSGYGRCLFCPRESPQGRKGGGLRLYSTAPGPLASFFSNASHVLLEERNLQAFHRASRLEARHEALFDPSRHGFDKGGEEILSDIIGLFVARARVLETDRASRYILVYHDWGMGFGLDDHSSRHIRFEMVSLPFVPLPLEKKLEHARHYWLQKRNCVFCAILEEEKARRKGVVHESRDYLAFCPFASGSPLEIAIYPKRHDPYFSRLHAAARGHLASLLNLLLGALKAVVRDPAYHVVFHQAPHGDPGEYSRFFHWHVEIVPRLGHLAGFEWGSGIFINPILPEEAAGQLRGVLA